MRLPKLPDWIAYLAVVVALLFAAVGRRENADAPPAPPPMPQAEGEPLAEASRFDPVVFVDVPDAAHDGLGTAFSVDGRGVWVTARHVVDGCRRTAILTGQGRGVAAEVRLDPRSEAAVLITRGGVEALSLDKRPVLRRGERAFHPGYPQGQPGEASSRLIGRETLVVRGRGAREEPVLAWAETGRTDGLTGTLGGLSGSPALDAQGRVIGVTIAESPRRGRIYTTTPDSMRGALAAAAGETASVGAAAPVTPENYGRVADALRREMRVAQVICLTT